MTPEQLAVLKAWLALLPEKKCNGCSICYRREALDAAIKALESR